VHRWKREVTLFMKFPVFPRSEGGCAIAPMHVARPRNSAKHKTDRCDLFTLCCWAVGRGGASRHHEEDGTDNTNASAQLQV
jgi:hypothetical protein